MLALREMQYWVKLEKIMPGVVKRKYVGEQMRLAKSLNRPLSMIVETLKPGYTGNDLLQAFQEYYPFEWKIICEMWKEYSEKDRFLKKVKGKSRYNMPKPEKYFFSLMKVKYLLSGGFRKKHEQAYQEEERAEKERLLRKKRASKIQRTKSRVEDYKRNIQQVDPGFIDALIYAYHDRHNSTNDKMEIFKELQKFECEKTDSFFLKINDCEQNNQIRNMAFWHLQHMGHYVKLRKNFKGKKKVYQIEKSTLEGTPQALAERLQNRKSAQNKKYYDLFISHSSQDRDPVRKVVEAANVLGMSCYVDWTEDNDFLKRSMVSEYTREVLKVRMKQSRCLLYLSSENSRASEWVAFELDYYEHDLKRNPRMLILNGDDPHKYERVQLEQLKQLKRDKK